MMMHRRALMAGAAVGALATIGSAAAQERGALLKTLLELEINSWQYVKDKNVPAMQTYLADEAVLIFGDGSRFTKAEFLKA